MPRPQSIMVATWPVTDPRFEDREGERVVAKLIEAAKLIRRLKARAGGRVGEILWCANWQ